MSSLTEKMVLERSKARSLGYVRNLNVWGCRLVDISIVAKLSNLEVLNLRWECCGFDCYYLYIFVSAATTSKLLKISSFVSPAVWYCFVLVQSHSWQNRSQTDRALSSKESTWNLWGIALPHSLTKSEGMVCSVGWIHRHAISTAISREIHQIGLNQHLWMVVLIIK